MNTWPPDPTWITVTLALLPDAYPLRLSFRYDKALIAALRSDFGGEIGALRWNAAEKCWRLKRSQFGALCAAYGDRLTVAPEVWSFIYPTRARRQAQTHSQTQTRRAQEVGAWT